MHFSADELARKYLFRPNDGATLTQLHSEYDTLSTELARRYNKTMTVYPRCYAIEHGSAFLLYALVRSFKPSVVLETGVANGHSSFYILRALDANEHGQLHSIDCSAEVGSLISDQEKKIVTSGSHSRYGR
jgi:predicted O-methyltransferase YrrM